MLEYILDELEVLSLIDEEVARAADAAYAEDGTPLYDSIINTDRDAGVIARFVDDAVRDFAARAYDICKYVTSVSYEQATYDGSPLFYVVDNDNHPTSATTVTPTAFPVYTNKALSTSKVLRFFVPDFDVSMQDAAFKEITSYVVLAAVASFLTQRNAAIVPEYSGRAQAALGKAITLLKSRKAPEETWM